MLGRRVGLLLLASFAGCAAPLSAGLLPPLPSATDRAKLQQSDDALLAGQIALHSAQSALTAGEYEEAEKRFLHTVRALPDHPAARLGLAEVWLMLGTLRRDAALLELARQAAEQAAQLAPDDAHAHYLVELLGEPGLGGP